VALDQSALLEVLDALKTAEVDDRIRQAVQTIYQALIEVELTSVIGAAPHQRTEARLAQRNGHRQRLLATTAGDPELRIPKLRAGSFFPSLLEQRRRVDQAFPTPLSMPPTARPGSTACKARVHRRVVAQAVVVATGVW
jgi:putative transposase